MCMRSTHAFITSTGHGEPAITPVRSDDRSKRSNSGWASSAMNIVGTPYSAVQRSACDGLQHVRRLEGVGRG